MGEIKLLDTYVLCEILQGNEKYFSYIEEEFVLADVTLAEFYWVILKEFNEQTANYWFSRLRLYSVPCSVEVMSKGMLYRKRMNRNLSFFDVVGYTYAQENGILFVTGDKEFKNLPGVEFVPKNN